MPESIKTKHARTKEEALHGRLLGQVRGNLAYEAIQDMTTINGRRVYFIRVRCIHCGSLLSMTSHSFLLHKRDECRCDTVSGLIARRKSDLEMIWPAVVKAGKEASVANE